MKCDCGYVMPRRVIVLSQVPGPKGLKRSETESTQDRGENTVELGEAEQVG